MTHMRLFGSFLWMLGLVLGLTVSPPAALAQTDLNVQGLLSVVGHGSDDLRVLNSNFRGDSNFDHLRGRLFVDGGNQRTRAFVQLLYSDATSSDLHLYGAYLMHQLFEERAIYLEAGKIPLHDGIWASHTYANRNALVSIPLAYFYKSTLPSRQMPVDLEQVVASRGSGQTGVQYRDANGDLRGSFYPTMPMLYDNCWNYGAYVLGSGERYDYAVGITLGTPGAPVAGADRNDDLTLHARVGVEPWMGVKLHVSAARGAYLADTVTPWLPAGKSVNDYAQQLWIGSLEWEYRYVTVQSEVFRNHFETPVRSDGLGSTAWYMQAIYKVYPGWSVAARWDQLFFDEVDSNGQQVAWDDEVRRLEAGVGYRATRELQVKAVGQYTKTASVGSKVLPAVQLTFAF